MNEILKWGLAKIQEEKAKYKQSSDEFYPHRECRFCDHRYLSSMYACDPATPYLAQNCVNFKLNKQVEEQLGGENIKLLNQKQTD